MVLNTVKIKAIAKNGIAKKKNKTNNSVPVIPSALSIPASDITGKSIPTIQDTINCFVVRPTFSQFDESSPIGDGFLDRFLFFELNAARESERVTRLALRSNDFIALAYFLEYPTVLFLLDTPIPPAFAFIPAHGKSPRPVPRLQYLPDPGRCRPWAGRRTDCPRSAAPRRSGSSSA